MKLTNEQKRHYLQEKTTAVYSLGLAGFEIKGIIYDIDDYIVYKFSEIDDISSVHVSKIYSTMQGDFYFKFWDGCRAYLKDCLKV